MYKFQLLKTSWGIVVFLNVEDVENGDIQKDDIPITLDISLRFGKDVNYNQEILKYWFSRAIIEFYDYKKDLKSGKKICYNILCVDFSFTDFQEEGLYYAMQGWLAQRYNVEVPPHNAYYEAGLNKYIFPALKT